MIDIVRAERVDFQLAPGYCLEFYRFPDGEKRIGQTSAAVICGHKKNYFAELESKRQNHLNVLQSEGFEGSTRNCLVERVSQGSKGSSVSKTISLEDFRIFAMVSAFDFGKKPAKAIARALIGVAIETVARQAFGEEALTLEEIRNALCRQYAKTLDWLEEDRSDYDSINEHLVFLKV